MKIKLSDSEIGMAVENEIALPTQNTAGEYWLDRPSYDNFKKLISRLPTKLKPGSDLPYSSEVEAQYLRMHPKSTSSSAFARPEPGKIADAVLADTTGGLFESLNSTQRAAILPQLHAAGWQYQGKPLGAEALRVRENADSGLRTIATVREMLKRDPSLLVYGAIPGSIGARSFSTARREVSDVLRRLRSGSAIRPEEESFYNSQLPGLLDLTDTAAIEFKLGLFENLFRPLAGPRNQFGAAQGATRPKVAPSATAPTAATPPGATPSPAPSPTSTSVNGSLLVNNKLVQKFLSQGYEVVGPGWRKLPNGVIRRGTEIRKKSTTGGGN
jgi:hypothetical protein